MLCPEWLEKALRKVRRSGELIEPTEEVKGEEIVIGEITDERLKILYTLNKRLYAEVQSILQEEEPSHFHDPVHDPASCQGCIFICRLLQAIIKSNAVSKLLWVSFTDGLSEDETLWLIRTGRAPNIRKGWKIVACPVEEVVQSQLLQEFLTSVWQMPNQRMPN